MESLPHPEQGKGTFNPNVGHIYSYLILLFTGGILIYSMYFLYSPNWSTYSALGGSVFFFVLLEFVSLVQLPFMIIVAGMMALYIAFFYFMFRASMKPVKRMIDSPAGYFAIVGPAVIFLTLIISIIEELSGVGIGGASVESELVSAPYLAYTSIIYAPFAEEIGFRIIPLGIFSFILVYRKGGRIRDSLYSVIAPGIIHKRYNIKIGWIGWLLIVATSLLWGYAHVYYGAWDTGKMITVSIAGIALAVGYLKFGVYVDIPMHWLSNGPTALAIVLPSSVLVSDIYILWILAGGIAGLILLVFYFAKFVSDRPANRESLPE